MCCENLKEVKMIQLTPRAKEKLDPVINKTKADLKPFMHSLRYCVICVAWFLTLPFVAAAKLLGPYSEKIKPEVKKGE